MIILKGRKAYINPNLYFLLKLSLELSLKVQLEEANVINKMVIVVGNYYQVVM